MDTYPIYSANNVYFFLKFNNHNILNQGDCDGDGDCQAGHKCVRNSCATDFPIFPTGQADCCMKDSTSESNTRFIFYKKQELITLKK